MPNGILIGTIQLFTNACIFLFFEHLTINLCLNLFLKKEIYGGAGPKTSKSLDNFNLFFKIVQKSFNFFSFLLVIVIEHSF